MRALLLITLAACAPSDPADPVDTDTGGLPASYILPDAAAYPESVAFQPDERAFYLGSLEGGAVNRLDADGTFAPYFTPEPGWMTLGVKVNPDTGHVWVCAIADQGTDQVRSELWVFDTIVGTQATLPLGDGAGPINCNDLAFDGQDAYVTDRESGKILVASIADGSGQVWLEDDLLAPQLIGQNGIVTTPDRKLLVMKYAPAKLLRVSIDDPTDLSEVTIGGDALPNLPNGFDGATWDGDTLVIAANAALVELTSTDGWATATAVVSTPAAPIAAVTMAEGERYGLKGEVVPWVLGLEVSLPFELFRLE